MRDLECVVTFAHPFKQRKHYYSKQFIEWKLHTSAFTMLCHT